MIVNEDNLCHRVLKRHININVREANSGSELLGQTDIVMSYLVDRKVTSMPLINPDKARKSGYTNSGILNFDSFETMYCLNAGIIHRRTRLLPVHNCLVRIHASAKNLPKKDLLGSADPFLEFYYAENKDQKPIEKGKEKWVLAGATNHLDDTLNPVWPPFYIPLDKLTQDGWLDRPILIMCFDWNMTGRKTFISQLETTVHQLVKKFAKKARTWNFVDPAEVNKPKYTHSGQFTIRLDVFVSQGDLEKEAEKRIQKTVTTFNKKDIFLTLIANVASRRDKLVMLKSNATTIGENAAPSLMELTNQETENKAVFQRLATHVGDLERQRKQNEYCSITLRAEGIPKMDTLGWCDPFLKLYRFPGFTEDEMLWKTNIVSNTDKPKWNPVVLKASKVPGDTEIIVKCFDYDKSLGQEKEEYIGEFTCTFDDLRTQGKTFELKDPEQEKKTAGYKNSGYVHVELVSTSAKNPLRATGSISRSSTRSTARSSTASGLLRAATNATHRHFTQPGVQFFELKDPEQEKKTAGYRIVAMFMLSW